MDPARPEVTDDDLRALRVLQLALAGGAVMFWVVIGVMAGSAPAPVEADGVKEIVLLSAVHAFLAPTQWFVGTVLHRRTLASGAGPPLARLRAATILRLALFEGTALFGAVVVLLAVQKGALGQVPWVWANAASTLMLVGLVAATWPSRERVEQTLRDAAREP